MSLSESKQGAGAKGAPEMTGRRAASHAIPVANGRKPTGGIWSPGQDTQPLLTLPPLPKHELEPHRYPFNPPHWLDRSGLALFASVVRLVQNDSPCYLWLVTCKEPIHAYEFGQRHTDMINTLNMYAKRGMIRQNWGGVRVFEEHPRRLLNPLHSHLVLRGSMDFYLVQRAARLAGLGNIWRRPKVCDLGSAYYLCKYLRKDIRPKGVRTWACVGTFSGVRCRDIEFDSPRVRFIKERQAFHRFVNGKTPYQAFRWAVFDWQEKSRLDISEKSDSIEL